MNWIAYFSDGLILNRFTDTGETLFKEVENRMGLLDSFRVVCDNGSYYEVNLSKGIIFFNKEVLDKTFKDEKGLSLLYKRRNQISVDIGGKILSSPRVTHIIGIIKESRSVSVEIVEGTHTVTKNLGETNKKVVVKGRKK